MNIFFLSLSIKKGARYHFDKHVIKMIVECCQLLCTAWHVLDPDAAKQLNIYKLTHVNHPCSKWVSEHANNYLYVARLGKEWRYRYQHTRIHGCEDKLNYLYQHLPFNINKTPIIKSSSNPNCLSLPLPQAMPEEYKNKRAVSAYRAYYHSKLHLKSWKRRDAPYWWKNDQKLNK